MNVINTNMYSINAQRHMQETQQSQATVMERLSSGSRINHASDDAAGLTMVERMNSQVTGLQQSIRNANDGVSMVQVADGAMGSITDLLQRMRELSVQGSTGTYTDSNRGDMQDEFSALQDEISRIIGVTEYNDTPVLNRDPAATKTTVDFQVGWDSTVAEAGAYQGVAVSTETAITGVSGTETVGSYGAPGSLTGAVLSSAPGVATDNKTVHADQTFKVEIDGTESNDITIPAGTYTKEEWATQIQNAINADVNVINTPAAVTVSYNSTGDNFVITSESENTSATATSKVEWGTTGSMSELGLDSGSTTKSGAVAIEGEYESSEMPGEPGDNIGVMLAEKAAFSVNVDGDDYGPFELAAGTKTKSEWAAELQTQIRAATSGTETVVYDNAADTFTVTSAAITGSASNITVTKADEGMALFGFSSQYASEISLANESSANRELQVSVDGGSSTTITLPAESKTTAEWASYIEGEIAGVSVSFDDVSGQFNITSNSDAKGSTVSITGAVDKLGLTSAGMSTVGAGDPNQIKMNHLDIDDTANALGAILLATEQLSSQGDAMAMIGKLDAAIDFSNETRAHFGAVQNHLEHATQNLQNMHENHSASRSRVKDADFAAESAEMARVNVLQQAGISMLAQANQAPQQLMKLLQ